MDDKPNANLRKLKSSDPRKKLNFVLIAWLLGSFVCIAALATFFGNRPSAFRWWEFAMAGPIAVLLVNRWLKPTNDDPPN
jgi:hypothetical protein